MALTTCQTGYGKGKSMQTEVRSRGGTWKNVHGASVNRVWRAEQDPRARAVLLRHVSLKKARAKFGR